jgi:hypothetical protein
LCPAVSTLAHETRPFYLGITETGEGRYEILWRRPIYYGRLLPVALRLPEGVEDVIAPIEKTLPDVVVTRRIVDAGAQGLSGRRIAFDGLQSQVITDVLVRAKLLDGSEWTQIARPGQPWVEFTGAMGRFEAALAYLKLGVQHILLGIDHLLFVLGLLLLSRGVLLLVKTITAFTVGHSLSLALATLGFISVPAKPLSAVIALSIVFLAAELVRAERGESSLTIRNPWLVSFGFGLLHGIGFAGALVALGLPQSAIPLALFMFNVGVEIGQLLFVFVVLALLASIRRLAFRFPEWARQVPVYAMGSVAGLWFVGRVVEMF